MKNVSTNKFGCILLLSFALPLISLAETGTTTTIDGTNLTVAANFGVGATGPSNTLHVINGGSLNNEDGFVGLASSADHNIAEISGANSTWNNQNWNNGYAGASNLVNIVGGGAVNAEFQGYIGRASGSDNNRVLVADTGSTLEIGGTLFLGNAGKDNQLIVSNNAQVVVGAALIVGNNSDSTGNQLLIESGEVSIQTGTFRLAGQGEGTVTINGGRLASSLFEAEGGSGSVINFHAGEIDAGNLQIQTGVPMIVGDGTQAATLRLGATSHIINNGLQVSENSQLIGLGDIVGDLTNSGSIFPGEGPAVFSIFGDSNFDASSNLELDLHGPGAGAEHDQFIVSRTAVLDGNLSLRVGNGFQPGSSDEFVVLQAQTLSGTFANAPDGARINSVDGSGSFQVNYFDQTVVISGFAPSMDPLKISAIRLTGGTGLEVDVIGLRPGAIARVFRVTDLFNDPLNNAVEMDSFTPSNANETWIGTAVSGSDTLLILQEL